LAVSRQAAKIAKDGYALDTAFEVIKQTLESGEDVLISGFGKFSVRVKGEKRGRNPQTGEPMVLAPRRVATFKCSRRLKNKINKSLI
jgi:integration host factor subunit alpha